MGAHSVGRITLRVGLVIAAVSALGLSACGPSDPAAANAAFNKSFNDSCVPKQTASGASQQLAESYCTCIANQLDQVSLLERVNPSNINKAEQTCIAQMRNGAASNTAQAPGGPDTSGAGGAQGGSGGSDSGASGSSGSSGTAPADSD